MERQPGPAWYLSNKNGKEKGKNKRGVWQMAVSMNHSGNTLKAAANRTKRSRWTTPYRWTKLKTPTKEKDRDGAKRVKSAEVLKTEGVTGIRI